MSLLVALLLVPAVAGVVSYFVRSNRLRRLLWGAVAAFHFSASVVVSLPAPPAVFDGWIGVDSLSAVFLVLTSLLFLAVTVYGIGYVHREPVTPRRDR
jgi:formate hydrogenlyase subunit 3/multisubunit Na+/H+ antiporter MnhD subunit